MKTMLGVILGLLLLLILGSSLHDANEAGDLARTGLRVQASITALEEKPKRRGFGMERYLHYRYAAPNGGFGQHAIAVDEAVFRTLRVGMPVDVRVDPRSPDRHVLLPYGLAQARDWTRVALFLGMAAAALYWAWRRFRKPASPATAPSS